MNEIKLIVAVSNNKVIGNDFKLLWKLSDDLKHFKNTTSGFPVIMGRKTFDSIGKPLPNRLNIVVSKTVTDIQGCVTFDSLVKAIEHSKHLNPFIIGGGQIYKEALEKNLIDTAYVTEVDCTVEGDTFFDYDFQNWNLEEKISYEKNEKNEFNFEVKKYANPRSIS